MIRSSLTDRAAHRADPLDTLWNLLATPTIDPATLARTIESVLGQPHLDWRTLQLVKEGWEALEHSIEPSVLSDFLIERKALQIKESIRARLADDAEGHRQVKFPSLKDRLMPHLSPITVRQFLRELGTAVESSTVITIGGAASLILRDLLSRATEDVDIVDEVPVEIRAERHVLEELSSRYGLHLTHFQSHYLSPGWESRTTDLGTFGKIQVRLVDPLDIIAGKVFSARPKDLDDFRLLSLTLEKEALQHRVLQRSSSLDPGDQARRQAIRNWYIVYGDDLGLDISDGPG
jgi:Nucleotidyltransferase of unknown function (DUF6036)